MTYFDHIFVQNQTSQDLLQSIGIQNVSIGKDTRFDRVQDIANTVGRNIMIDSFKDEMPLLIIGSCWKEDFEVLMPFLNNFTKDLKVIIAPHEINEEEINLWKSKLIKAVTLSESVEEGFDFGPISAEAEAKRAFSDGESLLIEVYEGPHIPNQYLPNCLIIDNI